MEENYLMWLSRVDGIGFKRIDQLLKYFGTAKNIWNAQRSDLLYAGNVPEKIVDAIFAQKDEALLDQWIMEMEEKGIDHYSYYHPLYPALLKEIYNPPAVIYVKGTMPDDMLHKVGIVGARRCSTYGSKVAHQIAGDLAKANVVVVSGMAKGIDAASHKGAIDALGQTIAVLGCGVDICYPAENRVLMDEIISQGCILSEYPPGTPAFAYNFPQRNRIISGLVSSLLVVEAGKKSGTLITADLALESGRDVFAVPGNITSSLSEGTNRLIKQGCSAVTEADDILWELGIRYKKEEKQRYSERLAESLEPAEREVFDCIYTKEPVLAETICRKLHKNIQEVQYILSLLEIAGHIIKLPQAGYIRRE